MVWGPGWHLSYQPQFHEPTWKMGENFCASSSPLVSTVSHKSSVRTNMVQAKLIQSHILKIYLDVVCWGTTILKPRYLIHLLCNLLRAHFTYRLGQGGMLHLPHCVHIWGFFFLLWTHTLEIAKDTELALHFKCQSWIISMWKKSDWLKFWFVEETPALIILGVMYFYSFPTTHFRSGNQDIMVSCRDVNNL